jgi:hypothetical protein
MTTPARSHGADGPQGPEDRFLQIAGTMLADAWSKRFRQLPSAVGDAAYDAVLDTVMRRAWKGVDGFLDVRGNLDPELIKRYVRYVVDKKIMGAWSVTPRTTSIDVDRVPAGDVDDEDFLDLLGRLERDRVEDDLLTQAREKRAAFEREARKADADRLKSIAACLGEHGVTGIGAKVVMLRAARELSIYIGVGRLEARYLPAMPFQEVAKRLGIEYDYARKLSSRMMQKLPPTIVALIKDPMGFEQRSDDAGPEVTGAE